MGLMFSPSPSKRFIRRPVPTTRNLNQLKWSGGPFNTPYPNLLFSPINNGTTNFSAGGYNYLSSYFVNATNFTYTTNTVTVTNSTQTQINGNASGSATSFPFYNVVTVGDSLTIMTPPPARISLIRWF